MFLKNLFKPKGIKIIRVSNEGFDIKPYDKGSTDVFLDVVVTDLNQTIIPNKDQVSKYEKTNIEGCFCFLEGFDQAQLSKNGNLFFRENNVWNIGYLPKDELVFVRNTKNNQIVDKFAKEFYTGGINAFTGEPNKEKLNRKPYEFIKMPLYLATERLKEHIESKSDGKADEEISELYLTKEQIKKKLKIKK